VGESSFWYRPTRVVPDQRPLNGRCCCCLLSATWTQTFLSKQVLSKTEEMEFEDDKCTDVFSEQPVEKQLRVT